MIFAMTRVARSVAATLALAVTLFPIAMERCRTSCAAATVEQTAPAPAHGCHDTIDSAGGAVAAPLPATCGHSIEARIDALAGRTVSKTRIVGDAAAAIPAASLAPAAIDLLGLSPPAAPYFPSALRAPRNLPLRV